MTNETFRLHLKFMLHIVFQDLSALVHRQAAMIDKQGDRIEEQSVQIKVREYFAWKWSFAKSKECFNFYHIKCLICNNLIPLN